MTPHPLPSTTKPTMPPAKTVPTLDEVSVEHRGSISIIRLARPKKRNAISDGVIAALAQRFDELPASTKAVVIDGEGEHFCAGLDLSSLKAMDAVDGVHHSRSWHKVFTTMEFGRVPIVAALIIRVIALHQVK